MQGIVVLDKPNGMTSHQVVQKVRRKFNIKRVGHAGTLDPMATGVLIMLLGKSTKLFDQFMQFDKAYHATLLLGTKTDTADTEGKTIEERDYRFVTVEDLENAFSQFRGTIEQLPPMYSAVRVNGKKLYEYARAGQTVKRTPRTVTVHRLTITEFKPPYVSFYMECSKGTYVRQIAEDVGEVLGCGACISQLQRTKIGDYSIEHAVTIDELNESHIQHWCN